MPIWIPKYQITQWWDRPTADSQNIQMAKEKTSSARLQRVTLVVLHTHIWDTNLEFYSFPSQQCSGERRLSHSGAPIWIYINEAGMFILISQAANNGTKTNKLPQNDSIACDTLSRENMLANNIKIRMQRLHNAHGLFIIINYAPLMLGCLEEFVLCNQHGIHVSVWK